MKRLALVAVTLAAIASLVAPSTSAAQASPTLTLQEACETFDGTRLVGVAITVTGVAPFSTVSGSVSFPGGGVGGSIGADATGVASTSLFAGPGLYTVEVTSPFSATESLAVDCLPDNGNECKNGRWETFEVFKNEGDCVSFVATGGKNPPANPPAGSP